MRDAANGFSKRLMTNRSKETGQKGETIAQAILRRKGFRIEAVNWRSGKLGEIDLIAWHPQERLLAFVEVKTRKSGLFGSPAEAVNARKQAQIATLAEIWLAQHPPEADARIRFDVIGIYYPGQGKPAEITHIEDAF
jgi:putative endonuclease